MRLAAAGWARNHGATDVVNVDLNEIEASREWQSFGPSNPKIRIEMSRFNKERVVGVTLHAFAALRFTGDYHVTLRLEKHEIAQLFRLTHKPELDTAGRILLSTLWPDMLADGDANESNV